MENKIPRKDLDIFQPKETADLLIENNAIASKVFANILLTKGLDILCNSIVVLDDMNIRGQQVEICYDLFCNSNLDLFLKTINEPYLANEMVNFLNGAAPIYGIYHKAVLFGAKEINRPFLEEIK